MKPRSYRPSWLLDCLAILLVVSSATLSSGHASGAASSSKKSSPTYFPSSGFGGYNWYGTVRQISAQWRVPTIHPSCRAEAAATWIGAQHKGGGPPFIQLGTLENNAGCVDDQPGTNGHKRDSIAYQTFWTDSSLEFIRRYCFPSKRMIWSLPI
jgi:hypothetical protein